MDEERILKIATTLVIIGGVNSVISGGSVALSSGWFLLPVFGFVGFVLGILIILGGMLISVGRTVLGGNLALLCGIFAFAFGLSHAALFQTFTLLFGQTGSWVGYVLAVAISVGLPVLGGILALIYG